jgi:hypothetical protein
MLASFAAVGSAGTLQAPSVQRERGHQVLHAESLTVGSPPLGTPTLSVGPKQPFQVAFGPGRLHGTFDLQYASEADERIKAWEALKMFLKKRENEEAAN